MKKKDGLQSYEGKLSGENNILKRCLDEVSKEKAHMAKCPKELQAKLKDLVFQHKDMVDNAFKCIMTKMWNIDCGCGAESGGVGKQVHYPKRD